jgi:arylamine N-acetyltransferase
MNVSAYLNRIAYRGPTGPNSRTLRALHRAHLETVPFENLDITRLRLIVLDEDRILRKVVEERRGGFCYEPNAALATLLRALGFQVALLSGRVARADGSYSPEFDHLALRVDLERPWLADVVSAMAFGSRCSCIRVSSSTRSQEIFALLKRQLLWRSKGSNRISRGKQNTSSR